MLPLFYSSQESYCLSCHSGSFTSVRSVYQIFLPSIYGSSQRYRACSPQRYIMNNFSISQRNHSCPIPEHFPSTISLAGPLLPFPSLFFYYLQGCIFFKNPAGPTSHGRVPF